ncbi:MAG: hypothetical protein KDC92_11475 [Bacteroidetes bacterium]|nr:hypothetical protein [Bacteroidota bacterium]
MRPVAFLFLCIAFISFADGELPKIRDQYYTIPLEFLPALKDQMPEDNRRQRDLMITKHDAERGFMILEKKGTNTDTKLQQYIKSDNTSVICIETTGCEDKDCENSFKVIENQNGTWTDITTKVAPDVDYNIGKVRGVVKKAYKADYDGLDEFNNLEYDDDNKLKAGLIWTIEKQENNIYLRETRLPLNIFKLVWNKKRNTFELEKAE